MDSKLRSAAAGGAPLREKRGRAIRAAALKVSERATGPIPFIHHQEPATVASTCEQRASRRGHEVRGTGLDEGTRRAA